MAAPIFDRTSLRCDDQFTGPALIVQADASLAVPPGVNVSVESTGDLVLKFKERR